MPADVSNQIALPKILIGHARIATLGQEPRLIEDGALLVHEGRIAALGGTAELAARNPTAEWWDAGGQLLMPAALCAHTHFYGAFARGMAIPGEPPHNFPQILERLWWRLNKALTLEDVRASALVCLADAIRHGTTTLIDHHASPNAIPGSLDTIAEAVRQAGVRVSLCYEVTDRDGPARARAGIAENVRFARSLAASRVEPTPLGNSPPAPGNAEGPAQEVEGRPVEDRAEAAAPEASSRPRLLAASFGLHASLTLSDETLAECVGAARDLDSGFHVHVAEDIADQEDALRRSGQRVVHRLRAAGVLGPKTLACHCVHVDKSEIEALAASGTWVTHQPRSNMNNAVGVAPVESMLQAGVKVALGNDGFSNQMFAEMKAAYLVHKLAQHDPRAMPGDLVLRLAYASNGQLARIFWPDTLLGELRAGASADLVLLDYRPTTPLAAGNLPWHLVFGLEASAITATICAGRVLMRDRRLLTLDEEAITAQSRELAALVWRRV